MHHGWIFAPALLALAAAGCSPQQKAQGGESPATLAGPLIKGVYALRACTPKDEEIKGTIRIVIPKNIDGIRIARNVTIRTGRSKEDEYNVAAAEEPFDVFLKDSGLGREGYARVKVVIKATDKWRFHVAADQSDSTRNFYGVGANDPNDAALCGVNPIGQPQKEEDLADDKEIAIFYVDLKAMAGQPESYVAPFTIGLDAGTPGSRIQTPILIDPKIRNNGGR